MNAKYCSTRPCMLQGEVSPTDLKSDGETIMERNKTGRMTAWGRVVRVLAVAVCAGWGMGVEGEAHGQGVNPEYVRWQKIQRLKETGKLQDTSGTAKARSQRAAAKGVFDASGVWRPRTTDEEILVLDEEMSYGVIPEVSDKTYLQTLNAVSYQAAQSSMGLGEALPEKYDLRDSGHVTSVKDQGTYGTCWAHATLSSIESWLLLNSGEQQDLSEKHLARNHGWDWKFNDGGSGDSAAAYLTRWNGPIAETDDPYPDRSYYDTWYADYTNGFKGKEPYDIDDILPASPKGNPLGHVQQIRWIPTLPNTSDEALLFEKLVPIKRAIMDYGTVYASYYTDNSFYTDYDGKYNTFYKNGNWYVDSSYFDTYYLPKLTGNGGWHAVSIVGWDDKFSADNFKYKAPGDGAFIAKNSWGKEFGMDGYFYVSYYDLYFAKRDLYSFGNLEPTNNYGSVYQYDPLGYVWAYNPNSDGSETAWGANMFTATNGQSLAAVGFYAMVPGTSYQIEIYTGCIKGKPVSGTKRIVQRGTAEFAGYTTIPLNDTVAVGNGTVFSAVLKLTTRGVANPLPLEGYYYNVNSRASANENESFVSSSGEADSWKDLTSMPMRYGRGTFNLCCKVYTVGTAEKALSSLAVVGDKSSVTGGESVSFTATAEYTDHSTADTTAKTKWEIAEGAKWARNDGGGQFTAQDVEEQQKVVVRAVYTEDGVSVTNTAGFYVTVAAPPPPERVTASQGTDEKCVQVNWSAAPGATMYSIYRGTENTSRRAECIQSAYAGLGYADKGAKAGVDYWYFVKSANASGFSTDFSEGTSGWRKLAPPEATTVQASDGTSEDFVLVSWGNSEGAECYRVWRAESLDEDAAPLGGWQTECTYMDRDAEPGVIYLYYVESALDSQGTRASGLSVFDDGFRGVPVVPEKLVVEGPESLAGGEEGTYTAYLAMSDGSVGDDAVAADWSVSDAGDFRVVDGVAHLTAPLVERNMEITLAVQYRNGAVDVAGEKSIQVKAGVPGQVTGLRVTSATAVGVGLAWDAAAGASGYAITRTGGSGGTATFRAAGTEYTDATAGAGVEYAYTVAAENAAGTGLASDEVQAFIGLAAPGGVVASGDREDCVRVRWGATAGATFFRVGRATSESGAKTELGTWTPERSFDDSTAAANVEYWYFVKAATGVDGSHEGPWSAGAKGMRKPVRTLAGLTVSGPERVGSGENAVYSCVATWSEGDPGKVPATWTASLGTIGAADGKFQAPVAAADTVSTIVARYGGMAATQRVTVVGTEAVATATVTDVSAAQRWPFAGLVDIDYTLETSPTGTKAEVSVSAVDEDHGKTLAATTLEGDGADGTPVEAGSHRVTWNLGADFPEMHAASLRVEVAAAVASLAAPKGVAAFQGTSTEWTRVSWQAVSGAATYEVWRGTGDDVGTATRIASGIGGTAYSDAATAEGALATYWVRAIGAGGIEGEWSAPATGYRAFSAPGNAKAVSTPDGVVLTWTGTSGNYIVYRAATEDESEARSIAALTVTTYTYDLSSRYVTNHFWVAQCAPGKLRPGVKAYCGAGCKVLGPVTGLVATGTVDGIVLGWNSVDGASSFAIYRSTTDSSGAASKIATVTSATYTDTTAQPGTRYYYWIESVSASGTGEFSAPADAVRPLSAPTGLTANGTTSGIALSWNPSAGATGYEVWRNTSDDSGSASKIGTSASTSYSDTTVVPGTQYYYWAKAVCTLGTSAFSISAKGMKTLLPPTGVSATQGDSWSQVTVSWSNATGATTYEVWRSISSSSSSAEKIGTTGSMQYNDRTAQNGMRYYYWVKSVSRQGGSESTFSDSAVGYTPAISTLVIEGSTSLTGGGRAYYETKAKCTPDGLTRALPSDAKRTLTYGMQDSYGCAAFKSDSYIEDAWEQYHGYRQWLIVTNAPASGSKTITINAACSWNGSTITASKSVTIRPSISGLDYLYQVNSSNEVALGSYSGTATDITVPSTVNGMRVVALAPMVFRFQSIKSVTLPSTLRIIGGESFFGCTQLTALSIPSSVTRIGGEVILGTKITTINIPASVIDLDDEAFTYARYLTSITVDSANERYTSWSGVLFSKDMSKLIACPGGKSGSFTVPAGVTDIGNSYQCSFKGCSQLTAVSLPNSVVYAPWYIAFKNCPALASISVDSANTNLCVSGGVLFNKDMTRLKGYPAAKSGTSYIIPSTVKNIDFNAFERATKMTTLVIPASVTNLSQCLSGCTNMTSIYCFGDAPATSSSGLYDDIGDWDASVAGFPRYGAVPATVYYLSGTSGWTNKLGGLVTAVWNNPIQSLSIDGATSVRGGSVAQYIGKGTFQSGHSGIACKVTWSITSGGGYASIGEDGTLTASAVETSQTVTLRATATLGGTTRTASKTVTITP